MTTLNHNLRSAFLAVLPVAAFACGRPEAPAPPAKLDLALSLDGGTADAGAGGSADGGTVANDKGAGKSGAKKADAGHGGERAAGTGSGSGRSAPREPKAEPGTIALEPVGTAPHLRLSSAIVVRHLAEAGAAQLVVDVPLAGATRHYIYSEKMGAVPLSAPRFQQLGTDGRLHRLPADPALQQALRVGGGSAYYLIVGEKLSRSLSSAIADAGGSPERSIVVLGDDGSMRVALARR